MKLLHTAAAFILSTCLILVELLEATTYSLEHAGWGRCGTFLCGFALIKGLFGGLDRLAHFIFALTETYKSRYIPATFYKNQ